MSPATLVCLPYAGVGASFFRDWQSCAPRGLDILPVQLPGREERFGEDLLTSVDAAVHDIAPRVLPVLRESSEVAVFGHSLGAVLAYELAHRLTADGGVALTRLFVSGSPGPATVREIRASSLADEEFLDQVGELAGYSHPALANAELRELLLPVVRADVEMHENYRPPPHPPLDVPITALRGRGDHLVGAAQLAEWAATTTAGTSVIEVDGGHMYLTEHPHALVRLLAAQLAEDAR
ncbi:thioesterase II family protein [Rhodococcus sp. NM-2]|jgi:surfactin synthase thioesterase subunit|uniref:thioesterase II family protein n=1 Tax=Rhodococcus TaxID=1827 RepID=UPI00247510BA|nr:MULTISPECIES: alpha/beta fold hydrolase [Rhodococcus]MDH6292321.1 surfactin synthase thioesterase subunit [Rhodococcus opacus]MDI9976878.1 alpha/beta fold hydrolase [Rhodococcus sp. IEGM 1307]